MDGQRWMPAAAAMNPCVQQKKIKQIHSPQPSAIKHGSEKKLSLLLHYHDGSDTHNNDAA